MTWKYAARNLIVLSFFRLWFFVCFDKLLFIEISNNKLPIAAFLCDKYIGPWCTWAYDAYVCMHLEFCSSRHLVLLNIFRQLWRFLEISDFLIHIARCLTDQRNCAECLKTNCSFKTFLLEKLTNNAMRTGKDHYQSSYQEGGGGGGYQPP